MYLATISLICFNFLSAQNIGIGTNTPHPKAILEIKATDKGILFPRMTTGERNGITSPPNGLHVFNTDEHCLNYYDSVYTIWNCYCTNCQVVVINITTNLCKVNFYDLYAKASPASKYLINIMPGVIISGCVTGDTALSFNTMVSNASVLINNYGTIAGAGGEGGRGRLEQGCSGLSAFATPGKTGGNAISTKTGVAITINNYGIVAGGGGGGGGSARNAGSNYGGGGGGGAGIVGGIPGAGGGAYVSNMFGCFPSSIASPGATGTATTGGSGGAGSGGGPAGGNGGNRGMDGLNGTGNAPSGGGLAGKAIGGGSGNILNNLSGGQSFGIVD